MKRIIKGKSPRLERQLDRCNKLLLSMKRECGDWQLLEDVTGLAAGIMTAFSYMETFMEEFPEFPERETVLDFYFCLRDFLNVYEELDGHYRIYEENREDGSFLVRLFCVDPSRLLPDAWIREPAPSCFRPRSFLSGIIRPCFPETRRITRCM